MNKYRIGTDVPFQLSVDDGVEYLDLSNCTILNVAMYCDAKEAFAGSCTWELNAADHTRLDCVYPGNRQVYTGIMRAVVVMQDAAGENKAYDLADIFEMVATTEEANATEEDVTSAVLSAWQLPMSTLATIVDAAINATEAATESAIAEISYTASTEDDGINVLHIDQADGTVHNFNIKNGSKGPQGIQGPQGEVGPQGEQGNPGSSQDYPFELENNLEDGSTDKALTGAMGKRLKGYIDEQGQDIAELNVGGTYKEVALDVSLYALRNFYIDGEGKYSTSSTAKHIAVAVNVGEHYKLVANANNTTSCAFLTSNDAPVAGGDAPLVAGTQKVVIPAGSRAVLTVPPGSKYLYIYRGLSSSGYPYTPALIALVEPTAQYRFATPVSTNLIDPSLVTGGYLDETGKAYDSDNYIKTAYIPVEANKEYTVLCRSWNNSYYYRFVTYFNSAKTRIGGVSSTGASFTTPASTAYVVVSLYKKHGDTVIPPSDYGLFEGASPTWEAWPNDEMIVPQVPLTKKANEAVVTRADLSSAIDTAIESLDGVPPMTVQFTNPGITISAAGYANGCSLDRHYLEQFAYSGNHTFNFDNLTFGEAFSTAMNDDVAPGHFQNTTLGANHAQPTQIATIAGHGKTNADIGTAWVKDNTTFYIVRIVDEDKIEFLSENKGTYNNHNFVALTTGTLTKGAETMAVTAVSGSQLWPSVTNKSQRIILDAKAEIASAGTYKCHFADVIESYDIVNAADVITNLIARAGDEEDPVYTGEPMLRFENIFRFFPGGQVLVMENVIALQQVPMQDIMFNQAARFGTNGYVKYYVPNSLPFTGYDFRTPLLMNWSSSLPAFHFTTAQWRDGSNPPNRVVMLKSNSEASNGYGLAIGFLPFGVGKELADYTDNVFELRNNTGKVYPHGVHSNKVGGTMAAGMAYNAVMYRVPFAPQPSYRIAYYTVPFGDSIYAFVDYAESMSEVLTIGDEWNGKPIEVIEAVNCTLLTDVYNHGFHVRAAYDLDEKTCYMVVKIG